MEEQKLDTVILLHGLRQPRAMLYPLKWYLSKAGYEVHLFDYPSAQENLASHVARFEEYFVQVTSGSGRIYLVAHSLGSIIALTFLSQHHEISNVHRAVFLGPPLRGAQSARIGKSFFLTRALFGPVLEDLSRDQFPELPAGPEVGLISGGIGLPMGVNPILRGDNDGLVRVEETRTKGARDAIRMLQVHWLMSSAPSVMKEVVHFLTYGKFSEQRLRLLPREVLE